MKTHLKQHAKAIVDTLYDWLFDSSRAYHDPSSHATACVKPYANGEDTSRSFGYDASDYANIARDKAVAAASSASSAAASLTSHPRLHQHAGVSETLQQLTDPAFWHRLSPTDVWDNFIERCSSYLDEFQSHLGWEHLNRLAESWGVEPRIIILVMLLPIIMLLLSSCVFMGAGHTTDDGPPPYQGGRRGKKADPSQAGHNNANSASSTSSPSKQSNASSSGSSSSSGKGGKSRHGSKKGGAHDRSSDNAEGSNIQAAMPKGSVSNGGSKATMLGSIGFRGAELQHFKPIDIYAAMGMDQPSANRKPDGRVMTNTNRGTAESRSTKRSSSQSKKTEAPLRQGSNLHDENVVSSIMGDVVGPSDSQQEQVEIDRDNLEEYENDDLDDNPSGTKARNNGSESRFDSTTSKNTKLGERSAPHEKAGKGRSTSSATKNSINEGLQESNRQLQSHAPEPDHTGRQGSGPAGPDSESSTNISVPLSRTRVPRAYGFKEADRHRHQPHVSSRTNKKDLFGRYPIENQTDGKDYQVSSSNSLAFKIMDFAQRNFVMKNLDAISGGVLGATMATLAAGTAIVEASTNAWKGDFTSALDDLASNLKSSFDQAMVDGDLEGSGIDQDNNWDLRSLTSDLNTAGKRPVTTVRRFSVEDISVGPRTRYAIYVDPPQQSKAHGPDDVAPSNDDAKESDEDVKILDYQSYTQSKEKKNPADKSTEGVDWGNATARESRTNSGSGVDWGNAESDASSHKHSKPAQFSGSPATSGAQSSQGVAKHSAKKAARKTGPVTKAGTDAKQALDSAIKTSRDKLAAAGNEHPMNKDHADTQVHAATHNSKGAGQPAQDSVKKSVSAPKHDTKTSVQYAEDKVLKAVTDAKKAVDSARATAEKAIDTAAHIMKASSQAVEGPTKAIGSEVRTSVQDTKRNARAARKAARKAKNALLKGVAASRKKPNEDDSKHAAHEALRVSQETGNSATGIAQYAKNTVVGLAGNVVHNAANQARSAMDSVVDITKKTLWNSVVEPVKNVERMVGSAVEIGLGTVDAAIQGARETAEKLNQETATYGSGASAKRSEDMDNHGLEGEPRDRRALNHAHAAASTPAHSDQAIKDSMATYTQKVPISKKARRKAAKRQETGSTTQMTASDTQGDVKNSKDSSSESLTKAQSSRDLLSSAKHYAGGLGDAASEVVHAAQIAAQTLTMAKDNASAFISAASNDIQGVLSGPGHDHHELHDELRDIKNELKQKIHFHGISSSTSSAAKKADLVAQDYYNSLPDPEAGSSSRRSLASSDSTHHSQAALGLKSGDKNPTRSATLDHEEYVFKDDDGNEVSVADVDEADMEGSGSDESDESDSDDDRQDKHGRLRTLISHAPGILRSAKTAATAMATHVADVSYENFDHAKHSLSDMVDNLTENLAGHEDRDTPSEDDSESDKNQGRDDGAGWVRSSVDQNGTQRQSAKSKAQLQLHPSVVPHGKVAASKDGVVSFFPNTTPTHIHFQDHAFKPNPKGRHVDKDGFTIVEGPQLEHKHGHVTLKESQQTKGTFNVPKTHSTPQPQLQSSQHVVAHTVTNTARTTDPHMVTPRTHRSKTSTHPASSALSYSAAVKMNVEEGDHGPLVGRTESHKPSLQRDHSLPISDGDSLFQNQDIYDQTHHFPQEYTLDQQGRKEPLVREARRDSGFDLLL
ncbi:hypothetical protein EC968_001552 [Mortierella alpina]|nr:hypothetical protein EC968_001552 [Mortierella alpina]